MIRFLPTFLSKSTDSGKSARSVDNGTRERYTAYDIENNGVMPTRVTTRAEDREKGRRLKAFPKQGGVKCGRLLCGGNAATGRSVKGAERKELALSIKVEPRVSVFV